MTLVLSICVAITFAVSIYMMLGRELKGIAMGVFLLGHAAHLSIIAMSREPFRSGQGQLKSPPLLAEGFDPANPLSTVVDPLPQALILTAIVIGFAVMGFLLSLIVVTSRTTQTINVDDLAQEQLPEMPEPKQWKA